MQAENTPTTLFCVKHNLQIVSRDQNNPGITYCQTCLFQKTGSIPLDDFTNQQGEILQEFQIKNNKNKIQLEKALSLIQKYQELMTQNLNKIIRIIRDQIETINNFKHQFQTQYCQKPVSNEELKIICKNKQQNINDNLNQILHKLSEEKQKLQEIEDVFKDYNNQEKNMKVDIPQKIKQIQIQCELNKKSAIKQSQCCFSFAFNSSGNILFVGCCSEIIIYEFANGSISKELQRLTDHKDNVYCLQYLQNSNSFISGSQDKTIIIWEAIKKPGWSNNNQNIYSWRAWTQLRNHQDDILCLLVNKNEDQIISSSYDKTIRIWTKKNKQWSYQNSINTKSCGYSISLNDQENRLISCGGLPIIDIFELNGNNWVIGQQISVAESGNRLIFYDGDKFVFQPETKDFFLIYNYNNFIKKFEFFKEIQVQNCNRCEWFFQCQFIRQLNILTIKHGQYLNVFQIKDDDYKLIYTIDFQDSTLYGGFSDDGKILVTWSLQQKEIQVRCLKYLE